MNFTQNPDSKIHTLNLILNPSFLAVQYMEPAPTVIVLMENINRINTFSVIIHYEMENSLRHFEMISISSYFLRNIFVQRRLTQGQEVEFHEIEINFFMRSNSWDQIFFIFHEVKIPNNDSISWSAPFSWDWNCLIIQKKHYKAISISWSIC